LVGSQDTSICEGAARPDGARLGHATRDVGDLIGLLDIAADQSLGVRALGSRHDVVALPHFQDDPGVNDHDGIAERLDDGQVVRDEQ
jgi:hypothetical protein